MDKIGECNVVDGDIEVEVGVKYEDLNEYLFDKGIDLFFFVDFGLGVVLGGMMGIGGSGMNVVWYGMMRGDYIINVIVVLLNGELIIIRSRLCKFFVGLDLIKIFLGVEGMMGLVVKVCLRFVFFLLIFIVVVFFFLFMMYV